MESAIAQRDETADENTSCGMIRKVFTSSGNLASKRFGGHEVSLARGAECVALLSLPLTGRRGFSDPLTRKLSGRGANCQQASQTVELIYKMYVCREAAGPFRKAGGRVTQFRNGQIQR